MNLDFFGLQIESHSPNGSCDFTGPKKVSIHGPNRPRNEKNLPEKVMHGAVKFIGALIVITCIKFDTLPVSM